MRHALAAVLPVRNPDALDGSPDGVTFQKGGEATPDALIVAMGG